MIPFILHIESATDVCSVCLSDGDVVLSIQEANGRNDHAKMITLLISQCLEDAGISFKQLDAVALSSGPGSYTSLRVGASAAKGICYALEKPLIVVNTLQALALGALQKEQDKEALYCPMIDARRMEVYTGMFDGENNPVTEISAQVIGGQSYLNYFASEKKIIFCGNGAAKCKQVINSPFASFSDITSSSARQMVLLAKKKFEEEKFENTAYYTPLYLKEPNITIPKNNSAHQE